MNNDDTSVANSLDSAQRRPPVTPRRSLGPALKMFVQVIGFIFGIVLLGW